MVTPESEDAGLAQVKFDRSRIATIRHVKQEQFHKHKALRKEQPSNEYLASDSGSNVLLAVFDCRNMIPVAAQIPLSIKDLDGDACEGEQLCHGHWFRKDMKAYNTNDQIVVA